MASNGDAAGLSPIELPKWERSPKGSVGGLCTGLITLGAEKSMFAKGDAGVPIIGLALGAPPMAPKPSIMCMGRTARFALLTKPYGDDAPSKWPPEDDRASTFE